MSRKILKARLQEILHDHFDGKFPKQIPPREIDDYIQTIAHRLLQEVEPFWNIEAIIDATTNNPVSGEIVKKSQKLIVDCKELRNLVIAEERHVLAAQLELVSESLNKLITRRPRHDTLRKPQVEWLALRIIYTLNCYDVPIAGSQRNGPPSTTVAILTEIFDVVFRGFYSQTSSITNLISNLRNREREKLIADIEDLNIDIPESELEAFIKGIKETPFNPPQP